MKRRFIRNRLTDILQNVYRLKLKPHSLSDNICRYFNLYMKQGFIQLETFTVREFNKIFLD